MQNMLAAFFRKIDEIILIMTFYAKNYASASYQNLSKVKELTLLTRDFVKNPPVPGEKT